MLSVDVRESRPRALPSKEATTWHAWRTFTWKPRPEPGLDCLVCAVFVRKQSTNLIPPGIDIEYSGNPHISKTLLQNSRKESCPKLMCGQFRAVREGLLYSNQIAAGLRSYSLQMFCQRVYPNLKLWNPETGETVSEHGSPVRERHRHQDALCAMKGIHERCRT